VEDRSSVSFLQHPAEKVFIKLAEDSLRDFSDSAKLPYTVEAMCKLVDENCAGAHSQFNTTEECETYYKSLPHHNPVCQAKYGEFAMQGESLICKYLQVFTIL
jgi:hypothetical protein